MHASLDQIGQMVSFSDSPESYDSVGMATHLETQLQQCMALEEKLKKFNQQMGLDPRYITRVSTRYSGREEEVLWGLSFSDIYLRWAVKSWPVYQVRLDRLILS